MSTPVQTRGKHAERSQATRQHLIDTAIRVIQDRGYEAASLHEVAKAAGMTTGAVQHHFESRAVLMMQVLAGLIQADDHVGGLWPSPAQPLRERAHHFVHAAWTLIYAQPRFLAAWNAYLGSRATPGMPEQIAGQRLALTQRMREQFMAAFPELAGQPDAAAFIGMVFSTLRGLGLLQMFRPEDEAGSAQLDCLADTIVRRCVATPGNTHPTKETT